MTRRHFVATAGSALAAVAFGDACRRVATQSSERDGRLNARPGSTTTTSLKSGPLGLGDGERDGIIVVPPAFDFAQARSPEGKIPLLVYLHGATQNAASMVRRVGPAAEEAGIVVLAPDSRTRTWDAISGRFGEDVAFLDRALEFVFARLPVDPARLAIGGFSDGASYAISLGLANGDLFSLVVANSPGFVIPAATTGKPRFFVSHGTADQILPIDRCSRVIVPRLRSMGYEVTYREFEGRHELPPTILSEGLRWFNQTPR